MKPPKLIYLAISTFAILQINNSMAKHDNYWQQHVQYIITVELDAKNHILNGKEKICYTNNSPDTLQEIYMHLYANAFQEHSQMAREMLTCGIHLIAEEENNGYIKIRDLKISYDTATPVKYLNYRIYETLMNISLPRPLEPGGNLNLELSFEVKIRKFNTEGGKGGYIGTHHVISQWYPKICVYDKNGWNNIPYHWLGEFYGEFGTFDVTISTPYDYIIAATGEVISGNPGWRLVQVDSTHSTGIHAIRKHLSEKGGKNLKRSARFYAKNVHDFVWVTSPDFVYQTGTYKNITIHALYKWQDSEAWQDKVVSRCIQSIKWLMSYIGEFPYDQLTAVQGVGRYSMEYPMCVVLGMSRANTIFHEVAHTYFYGALANNEQSEGWLDEGLVTYLTELFSDNLKAKASIKSNLFKRDILSATYYSIRLNYLLYYLCSDLHIPLATPCYQNRNQTSYSLNNYVKGSFFFRMLNYVVGEDNFKKILQTLYQNYKFQHINEQRLYQIAQEFSESDLGWFFKQWLHTTVVVDYALNSFEKKKQQDGTWKTKLKLVRLSDGIMPFDVALITKNGDKLKQRCDGKSKHSELTFYSRAEPVDAIIDPDDRILDVNRLNNSRLKFKFILYPDYPNLYYQPRDRYLISGWPQAWYNDVDKLKIGARFFSGYLNRLYLTKTYLWYSFGSRQVDFDVKFTHPPGFFRKHLWYNLQAKKVEGRVVADANLYWIKRYYLFKPPVHKIKLGFKSYQLLDQDYVQYNPGGIKYALWDKTKINKLYFNLNSAYDKLTDNFNVDLRIQYSNQTFGSDRNFLKVMITNLNQHYFFSPKLSLTIRNFFGFILANEGETPIQEKLFLAGGSPIDQFEKIHLRSRGALPGWLPYHFPGDGNLRGYSTKIYNQEMPLSTDKIFTTNVEIDHRKLNGKVNSLFNKIFLAKIESKVYLFSDAGIFRTNKNNADLIADAGIGFTFVKNIIDVNRSLRIDFPLWLSKPSPGRPPGKERHFRFRWLMSFETNL